MGRYHSYLNFKKHEVIVSSKTTEVHTSQVQTVALVPGMVIRRLIVKDDNQKFNDNNNRVGKVAPFFCAMVI